jgi:hypothetical protein
MRANLKRIKLLFKVKTQPSSSDNSQGGDERQNTEVDGQMHSEEAKFADLVGEHLQTKEKTRMGRRRYEQRVERQWERGREQIYSIEHCNNELL